MGKGPGRTWDAEYLFDLERDPGETTNLAGDDSLEAAWLRSRLRAWVERGWVTLPGSVADDLRERGPGLTEWLDSTVALVVTPADVCGEGDRSYPSVSPGSSTRG